MIDSLTMTSMSLTSDYTLFNSKYRRPRPKCVCVHVCVAGSYSEPTLAWILKYSSA